VSGSSLTSATTLQNKKPVIASMNLNTEGENLMLCALLGPNRRLEITLTFQEKVLASRYKEMENEGEVAG